MPVFVELIAAFLTGVALALLLRETIEIFKNHEVFEQEVKKEVYIRKFESAHDSVVRIHSDISFITMLYSLVEKKKGGGKEEKTDLKMIYDILKQNQDILNKSYKEQLKGIYNLYLFFSNNNGKYWGEENTLEYLKCISKIRNTFENMGNDLEEIHRLKKTGNIKKAVELEDNYQTQYSAELQEVLKDLKDRFEENKKALAVTRDLIRNDFRKFM